MHWAYLDISGSIESDGICVIGAVSCQDPHVPQYLLRHPKNAWIEISEYFNHNSEFKFSSMIKDKFRVRTFLEETLARISKEPTLTVQAGVILNRDSLERGSATILTTGMPKAGEIRITVDRGSLEQYDFLYRISEKNADPTTSPVAWLGRHNTDTSTILESLRMETPSMQKIRIYHASSHDYCGIQLADLVAGAVFQKEARGNSKWFELLKNKARLEYFE